jgi:hypothetical protein
MIGIKSREKIKMTEKIQNLDTLPVYSDALTEQAAILDAADNLRAIVEADADDPDRSVADFVENTADAYSDSQATFRDMVIADEVGIQRALHEDDTKVTVRVLAGQPVESMRIALDIAASHDGPEVLDTIADKLEAIAEAADDTHQHTTDYVEVSQVNPFTEFIEQNNLAADSKLEVVEDAPKELTEQDIRRQNAAVDALLATGNEAGLLAFMKSETVVDVTALTKVVNDMGQQAFSVYWSAEESRAKDLYEIARKIGDKLQYVPTEALPELADSIVEKGGEGRLLDAVKAGKISSRVVVEVLMKHEDYDSIARAIDSFTTIDKYEFVNELYSRGEADTVLRNLYNFPDIDKAALVEQIYALDDCSGLAYHIDAFPDIDKDRLAAKLYEQRRVYAIVGCLKDFPNVDKTELIIQCIEQKSDYLVSSTPELFEGADIAQVKEKLLAAKSYEVFLKRRDIFPEISLDEIVEGLIESGHAYVLVDAIGRLPEITAESVYERLIETGNATAIVGDLPKFKDADANALMILAIDEGNPWTVMNALDSVAGIDKGMIATQLIQTGYGGALTQYREKVSELSDQKIASIFFDSRKYADFIKSMDGFKHVDSEYLVQSFLDGLNDDVQLSERDFTALNDYVSANVPTSRQPLELRLANRYMSFSGATVKGYSIVKDLHHERAIPTEAGRIGVTKTGVKGLEQFGVSCNRISRNLMDVTMDGLMLEEIQKSELYQGILQKMYRVDMAEFGDTSESGVKTLLDYYMQAQEDGRIASLDADYKPANVEILTLKSEREKVDLTEDAYDRYAVLRDDVMKAIGALETKQAFSHLTRALGNKISDEIASTRQQVELLAHEDRSDKAVRYKSNNLHAKEESLSTLIAAANEGKYLGRGFALRSPADMSAVFSQLEPFDSLHSDMRQITFAWALRKNPQMIERLKNLSDEPDIEDVSTMRSFVDQIVNNETFGNYFSDKKTAMKFKKLTSVRSLDEALVRHQSQATVESQQTLQIMPTRSFSMELSGHVADACWASKYDSMAEQFPNMTSLILKRGEDGSANERLVGSAMLIETVNDKNEPVLLLRGVNPIENYINKVQVSDFYNAMTSYCKTVAERKGMKPAIVIDDMSGASGTNRPALHDYMEKMKVHMTNIAVDEATTTFNGYDVTQKSYAL